MVLQALACMLDVYMSDCAWLSNARLSRPRFFNFIAAAFGRQKLPVFAEPNWVLRHCILEADVSG